MPNSVKYFTSSMSGAPALSGTAGTLIAVLDACLVVGFGSVTLNSLIVASNVVTGTVSGGHNFEMVGDTGPVITIAGATPAELNGEWRIASVPGSTTFTFATAGISDQTATGTITAKRSPAGWTKTYSGTNKAAYSRTALGATAMLLRVDDTPAQYPVLLSYETMSDVDTGTGRMPTGSTNLYVQKSTTANSTARGWRVYANAKTVYVFCKTDGTNWYGTFFFGDLAPYKTTDVYHCGIVGHATASNANNFGRIDATGSPSGSYLARNHTQLASAIGMARYSHSRTSTYAGYDGAAYPNPADSCFHAWPIQAWDDDSDVIRGILPGIWNPLHATISDDLTITGIPQLSNRTLKTQAGMVNGTIQCRFAFDIAGPW